MKKTLFILFTLVSLAACSGKKDDIKNNDEKKITSVESIETNITKENSEEETEDGFSNVAAYNSIELEGICIIEEVKDVGDPDLTELYGDLFILQEKADEWAKVPRSLDELEGITEDIGRIKGEIKFRSLRIYSAIN